MNNQLQILDSADRSEYSKLPDVSKRELFAFRLQYIVLSQDISIVKVRCMIRL